MRPQIPRALALAFVVVDVGFLLYWAITLAGVIPSEYLFKDYEDPILHAWNWSFLPLDLLISATGLTCVVRARRGLSWQPWALVSQTGVIISAVGPFALYGEPLVKVCAETGTDYCDLTGEPLWVRQMIEKYQKTAEDSGARMIPCAGFDSMPSDLGVFYLQQQSMLQYLQLG